MDDPVLEAQVSEQKREIARLKREVARLGRAASAATDSADKYRALFDSVDAGFCIIRVLFDREDKPVDFEFLDVNLAFERQSGLRDVIGKTMRTLQPAHEQHWFDVFGQVARTGEPARFENPAAMLGRYFDVYAFRIGAPEERVVGVLFNDVSYHRSAEAAQREASHLKDQFLATLAHELRNPLAPLQSGVEVLRMAAVGHQRDPAAEERVLEIMNRQIAHLRHLMDDLLDLSEINRGMVSLHKEPLDLVAAVRKGVEFSSIALYAGDRQVSVDLPDETLLVDGDHDRLVQVVTGLLDNAGKFTSNRGQIQVKLERHGGIARICVEDDGVGIDPEMLGKIFGMFNRARTDRHGLGIGLTVVRNLVELHGGTVRAFSRGRGFGSQFVVELPLAGDEQVPEPKRSSNELPPLERQRTLVVDDNRDAADSLAVLLGAMGAEVRTAYDGRTALLLLDELQPQIVFLDIGMPEMDGYEVARRIRARDSGREIVLVAVTGWGQPADRRRAKEAGFDSHLLKPATFEDLRQIITPRSAPRAASRSTSI